MRRYLQKPKQKKPDMAVKWSKLYAQALDRAKQASDPRLKDLEHFSNDHEKALRRLSILSTVDLDREFPPKV